MQRSTVNANVIFDIYKKTKDGIETSTDTINLINCASKEKAEIMLSKMHKNALVEIKNITFEKITREMDDETWEKMSVETKREVIKEDED